MKFKIRVICKDKEIFDEIEADYCCHESILLFKKAKPGCQPSDDDETVAAYSGWISWNMIPNENKKKDVSKIFGGELKLQNKEQNYI